MQTFVIPGWIWVNFVLLVAAAIFVGVKLAVEKKDGRQQPASVHTSPLKRAIK